MRPRKNVRYDADASTYQDCLTAGAALDKKRAAVSREATAFLQDCAARGAHPFAVTLGRRIMRERNPEKRRALIDACAKVVIDCEDLLLAEQAASLGHNGGPEIERPFVKEREAAA